MDFLIYKNIRYTQHLNKTGELLLKSQKTERDALFFVVRKLNALN